jgi:hypothetical protein
MLRAVFFLKFEHRLPRFQVGAEQGIDKPGPVTDVIASSARRWVMLGVVGVRASTALVIFLAFRGWGIIPASLVGSLVVILLLALMGVH